MPDLRTTTNYLHTILAAAQKERPQRPNFVDGPDGPEPEWATYERSRMHQTVNKIRAERDLPPLPVADIARIERMAAGHFDYSSKFALYCAELALMVDP